MNTAHHENRLDYLHMAKGAKKLKMPKKNSLSSLSTINMFRNEQISKCMHSLSKEVIK